MSRAPLLIEIGCEEIPARMIRSATADLARRVVAILDDAGLRHGDPRAWGGSRRLAVHVAEVDGRQPDRQEQVLGPPARAAFSPNGAPTPAALGFARKQGIDPAELKTVETQRGQYVGFRREVNGKPLGEVLAGALPPEVQAISFPKTMRWADGRWRWVRPVHWLLALHGETALELSLFGVAAGRQSFGHRFLKPGPVSVPHADRYEQSLEEARVLIDPARRCSRIAEALERAAAELGGRPVADPDLLEEVGDLIEWPGVVLGRFDPAYLDLPREILVTTLRHHQKCFSVQGAEGALLAGFLAISNTNRDRAGHIRRGNEWVVGGRLEDASFFWREDRKTPLGARSSRLAGIVFHGKLGSFADRVGRIERLTLALAGRVGLDERSCRHCARAARLCKNDLVTGTVGEFPELQGRVGGLLLRAEGEPEEVARAVYGHYQPQGPDDPIPASLEACVVSVADKLDSCAALVGIGEVPTGSRDPLGLRRAANGVLRIAGERRWPIGIGELTRLVGGSPPLLGFLTDRIQSYLMDRGFTQNEINAVFRPAVDPHGVLEWPIHDIVSRLEAIRTVRDRSDFSHLVDLTKRVDNILAKNQETFAKAAQEIKDHLDHTEREAASIQLAELVKRSSEAIVALETEQSYGAVVDHLASFVQPVERFFEGVLVIDPAHPAAMLHRRDLLARLRGVLTRCFDIRELAGQAERSE